MINNKKGITLVSLVITIVIMLILAAVTISLVIGDNGLFKKASSAKEQYIASSEMVEIEHVWDEYVTEETDKDYTQELTLARFANYVRDNNLLDVQDEQEDKLSVKINSNYYNVTKSDNGIDISKDEKIKEPEESNKLMLYDAGNEYTNITGGIAIYNANGIKESQSGSDRGTWWERKTNSIKLSGQSISGDGGSGYICMETRNLVNTTGYKTLHVKAVQSGYVSIYGCSKAGATEGLGIPIYSGGGVGGYYGDYVPQNGDIDITFDLTQYQGNYRLFLEMFHGDCHYEPIVNEISQMWLEK